MKRETKFNYGFLLVSLGIPLVVDYFVGRAGAVIAAIAITAIGVLLLLAGHQHREESEPKQGKWQRVIMLAIASLALGLSAVGVRAVWRKESGSKVEQQTSLVKSAEAPMNKAVGPTQPTANDIAKELEKMKAVKSDEGVPERWKIPGDRFSEMPTDELLKAARNMAITMRNDRDDSEARLGKERQIYFQRLKLAQTARDTEEVNEEWKIVQVNINDDLSDHFVWSYRPDAILLLKAMEPRVPAGTMESYGLRSVEEYQRRANSANISELEDMAKELERIALSIETRTPQLRHSHLLGPWNDDPVH